MSGERAELFGERLSLIRGALEEHGSPAALLQTRRNFSWATVGGEAHVVAATEAAVAGLLVTRDDAVVLAPVNEAPRLRDEELAGLDLEVRELPWHDQAAMTDEAKRIAGSRPVDDGALETALMPMRCVLSDLEVERMRWLAVRVVSAVAAGLAAVKPGASEFDIAAAALHELTVEGARAPVLLVAADDRIPRYRHPLPTDRRVTHRAMVVLVAERWGLHAALTRFAELREPDAELAGRIRKADAVHAAMLDATRPGRTLGDVLAAAQAAYADAGHPDEWQLHHQGGIIGYQGRERIATPGDATPMREGMAFAWNPSIAGAKAEETVLLGPGGLEVLTA